MGEQVTQVGGEALVQALHKALQDYRSLEPHMAVRFCFEVVVGVYDAIFSCTHRLGSSTRRGYQSSH